MFAGARGWYLLSYCPFFIFRRTTSAAYFSRRYIAIYHRSYTIRVTQYVFSFIGSLLAVLPRGISGDDSRQNETMKERVRSSDCETEQQDREKDCKNGGRNQQRISAKGEIKYELSTKEDDSNEKHSILGQSRSTSRFFFHQHASTLNSSVDFSRFPCARRLFIEEIRRVLEICRI